MGKITQERLDFLCASMQEDCGNLCEIHFKHNGEGPDTTKSVILFVKSECAPMVKVVGDCQRNDTESVSMTEEELYSVLSHFVVRDLNTTVDWLKKKLRK